jgi:hypothetical protein
MIASPSESAGLKWSFHNYFTSLFNANGLRAAITADGNPWVYTGPMFFMISNALFEKRRWYQASTIKPVK